MLILIVAVLIGTIGWAVHQNQPKAKPANPYAGWKTYTATLQPVSFKYPANWTVASGDDAPSIQAGCGHRRVTSAASNTSSV
jgi:hypothetical protein